MGDISVPRDLAAARENIADVTDRPVEFSPDHWRRQMERAKVRTRAIESLSRGKKSAGSLPTVSRKEVIRYAKSRGLEDPAGRSDAFVAAMIWGGGPPRRRGRSGGDSRAPWRIATALSTDRNGKPANILRDSVDAVREGRLADAYWISTALHWVNGAFATKWLWLVGELVKPDLRPAVWDSVIVKWLNSNAPGLAATGPNPARTRRDAARYADYVIALNQWAEELKINGGAARLEAYIFETQQSR